jgi:hypothetical protein
MERKIDSVLEEWKASNDGKALIITGCRQIGKTYSVREFGKTYDSFIELNLEDNRSLRELFKGDLSADSFLDRLSFIPGTDIVDGNTLLFIDEIQSCKEAISSLKPLAQSKRIHVIASGSRLGIRLKGRKSESADEGEDRLSPKGYTRTVRMHSMDFEEFLWAMGVSKNVTRNIAECIREEKPLDGFTLEKTEDLFRRYLLVGGMPQAVQMYADSLDYGKVMNSLDWIRSVLYEDITRYTLGLNPLLIRTCLESVPSQLAKENRRFEYRDVEMVANKGAREYGPSIEWLKSAGIVDACYSLNEPKMPLNINENRSLFKLYLSDTGLLALFLGPEASSMVMKDVLSNNGAFMENAVSCALIRSGYVPRYFATKDGRLEVDFVISDGRRTIALEVKSGKKKGSKSLLKLRDSNYGVSKLVKICEGNVEYDTNGTLHLPLFAPCFFEQPKQIELGEIDYIDDLNRRY